MDFVLYFIVSRDSIGISQITLITLMMYTKGKLFYSKIVFDFLTINKTRLQCNAMVLDGQYDFVTTDMIFVGIFRYERKYLKQ